MTLFEVYIQVKNDPACILFFADKKYNPTSFFNYLVDVPFQKISVKKLSSSEGIEINEFGVVDRFSEVYRKSIISKFYQLEDWYEEKKPPVIFFTLTARNKPDKEQFFKDLFFMRHLFFMKFSKLQKDYVWIVEPHRGGFSNDGYPHIHGLIFDILDQSEQDKLKEWWELKGIGDYEHGIKFEVPEKIKNVKNYIIKDIGKSWIRTEGKFSKEFRWDKNLFIFNFIMWKNSYRFWGASKRISKIMARSEDNYFSLPVVSVDFIPEQEEHNIFLRDVETAIKLSLAKNNLVLDRLTT